MLSPSGIPHAPAPLCSSLNVAPPRENDYTKLNFTWNNLCSEICTAKAAEEDNGVGKRRRRPSRVIISPHAVIVFDKDDDCDRLLFFEFDTC